MLKKQSTAKKDLLEWSHQVFSSTDSEVRTIVQDSLFILGVTVLTN